MLTLVKPDERSAKHFANRARPSAVAPREYRSLKVQDLRAETKDGKRYLSGYAALYNSLSENLGYWSDMYERIMPGAFTRAITERQDVRHLINHNPSLVLGRTAAGTTVLSEDKKGLMFRTLMPDTSYAKDLFASVERGDINECSFGFRAIKTAWIEEQEDPNDPKTKREIREVHDLDLFDVSTVTFPAYKGTKTETERAFFPDGVPAEIRSRLKLPPRGEKRDENCECDCPECAGGNCPGCSNMDCQDENCEHSMSMDQADEYGRSARGKGKTKRVAGEDLPASAFLIVGDVEDTSTWKLPVKFSSDEKTKSHIRNALARFNQLKGVSDSQKKSAYAKLVRLAKANGIKVSDEEEKSWENLGAELRDYNFAEPHEKQDLLDALHNATADAADFVQHGAAARSEIGNMDQVDGPAVCQRCMGEARELQGLLEDLIQVGESDEEDRSAKQELERRRKHTQSLLVTLE